jgi:pheromone shutdown protein TraB
MIVNEQIYNELFEIQNLAHSLRDAVEHRDSVGQTQPDLILVRLIDDRLTKLMAEINES